MMFEKFKAFFRKPGNNKSLLNENRQRFEEIISDKRRNYLEPIYRRIFQKDVTLTNNEILEAYKKFADEIETNTFAAAELEWVVISVLCDFRPELTETLIRGGLLMIVWSLGDDIDSFTVLQFIEKRILAPGLQPSGGLPPANGFTWLKETLPTIKVTIQNVLDDVIAENRKELDRI